MWIKLKAVLGLEAAENPLMYSDGCMKLVVDWDTVRGPDDLPGLWGLVCDPRFQTSIDDVSLSVICFGGRLRLNKPTEGRLTNRIRTIRGGGYTV